MGVGAVDFLRLFKYPLGILESFLPNVDDCERIVDLGLDGRGRQRFVKVVKGFLCEREFALVDVEPCERRVCLFILKPKLDGLLKVMLRFEEPALLHADLGEFYIGQFK